jgi:23S rRNA pseudouridine1911/1915/1917 synthase
MAEARQALNDGFDYHERLEPGVEAWTLLAYLGRRYPHSSDVEWAERIAAGLVTLDGKPARPDAPLRRGQALLWRRPPWAEPEAPTAFEVLYEDGDLLAVSKPDGLPTLPGANFLRATLLHVVRARFPDAAPLHRLGRWTSGIVLFAAGGAARAGLTRQWCAREIGKRYRALAAGSPRENAFSVTTPIGQVPHVLLGAVHAAAADGKPSSSRIVVLERRAHAFVCDVFIETGRPHQIRIHLAAAGYPLVGDPLYVSGGVPAPDTRAVPGDPGYLLHAAALEFRHPRDGRLVTIACAPPEELRTRAD